MSPIAYQESLPTFTKVTAEKRALHFGCAEVAPVEASVTPAAPTKVTCPAPI